MARSTSPEYYPPNFHDYVRRVGLQGEAIRVPAVGPIPDAMNPSTGKLMTGVMQAMKTRGLFYAYIGALKRARREGVEKWIEMANAADQTACYIDKEQVCLLFYSRSRSWQNQLLNTGGQVTLAAQPLSDVAKSLSKLQEQLKGGDYSGGGNT